MNYCFQVLRLRTNSFPAQKYPDDWMFHISYGDTERGQICAVNLKLSLRALLGLASNTQEEFSSVRKNQELVQFSVCHGNLFALQLLLSGIIITFSFNEF